MAWGGAETPGTLEETGGHSGLQRSDGAILDGDWGVKFQERALQNGCSRPLGCVAHTGKEHGEP